MRRILELRDGIVRLRGVEAAFRNREHGRRVRQRGRRVQWVSELRVIEQVLVAAKCAGEVVPLVLRHAQKAGVIRVAAIAEAAG